MTTSYLGSGERSRSSPAGSSSRDDPSAGSPRGKDAGFRPDIEGLRAVAIILVVAYHCGLSFVRGGFVGVDVFFVISGFLITSHLVREVSATGRLSIGRFYARRVMRLLPAAVLVIGVTVVAAWWWLPVTRLRPLMWDALAADGYALNYRLALTGTDYRTATEAPSALQHFWSLGVEEQFYLVIPVLLVLTLVATRRRGPFVAALALITAGSFWWSIGTTEASPVWAYFAMPSRAWELGVGALLAMAAVALTRFPPVLGLVLRWGGLAAIGVAAYRYDATTLFPGRAALLPVLGAAAVIAGGCVNPDAAVFGSGPMRQIGALSYSWYLWHWPVLVIAPFAVSSELGTTGKLAAAAVAFGFAALSYALVEHPLRSDPDYRTYPIKAAQLGVGITVAVALLALLMPMLPAHTPLGLGSVADVTLGGNGSRRTLELAKQIKAASTTKNLPANLKPSLRDARLNDPEIYRDGCHLDYDVLKTPAKCGRFGDRKGRTTMVLFGDSHAAQWFPAMQTIARQRHARLAVFTKGACAAAAVKIYLPLIKRSYDECVTWRRNAITQIRTLHPSIVVMSSNADGGDALGVHGGQDDAWTRAWEQTTKQLTQSGTRVVYLNDTPWPKQNVPECLAEHPRNIQKCAASVQKAAGSARRTMVAKAVSKDGATVVDPMPWFCSLSDCPVVVGNILVYKDDSHISVPYSTLLAPLLSEKLRPAKSA
jgi:peptidoglycan/LPS O-acetylase OafA/YrhL